MCFLNPLFKTAVVVLNFALLFSVPWLCEDENVLGSQRLDSKRASACADFLDNFRGFGNFEVSLLVNDFSRDPKMETSKW